jgi:hypothetical protein
MSYEGYVQRLCEKGHQSEVDAYADLSYDDEGEPVGGKLGTCHCGAKIVWRNGVDQTNLDEHGAIDLERFLLTPGKFATCSQCGHSSIEAEPTYRIPTPEETKRYRTYLGEDNQPRYVESGELVDEIEPGHEHESGCGLGS